MVLWIVAALLAFFVKGICGFANTLIFSSILSFGNSNVNITPVDLLIGYFSNGYIAFRERKHIRPKIVIPLVVLTLVGSIPGIFFLKNTDARIVKLIFGAVIILVSLDLLARELKLIRKGGGRAFVVVIGVISGLLFGMYGIGALLSACVGRMTSDTKAFKGNLCAIFFIENTVRLILYVATGIITLNTLFTAASVLPFMAIGLGLGMLAGRVMNERMVKFFVIGMLIVSGISVIITSL